jgi:hypothetical protein
MVLEVEGLAAGAGTVGRVIFYFVRLRAKLFRVIEV